MATSTGFDAGNIRTILDSFRRTGSLHSDGRVNGTGGGSAGTAISGKPGISLTYGETRRYTALALMHEIIHWAGMPAKQGGGYADFYNDTAMATAWNNLGVVIIHIYGNAQGTASNTALYAPSGGTVGRIGTDSDNNLYRRVSYSTGLTISFVHVIPDSGPGRSGSVRVGNIGGPDSGSSGYLHTHIVFFSNFKNRVRVDPRKVFCGQ